MKAALSRTAFVAALGTGLGTALWASAEETRVTFPDLDALMGLGPRLLFHYALDMWDFNEDTFGFFANSLSILGLPLALSHYGLRILRAAPWRIALGKAG